MIWRTVVALAFLPAICWAQSFERYQAKTLDAVFDEWNDLTKTYEVGLSVIRPQKIRFVATYRLAAQPCDTRALEFVLTTLGATAILKQRNALPWLVLAARKAGDCIFAGCAGAGTEIRCPSRRPYRDLCRSFGLQRQLRSIAQHADFADQPVRAATPSPESMTYPARSCTC